MSAPGGSHVQQLAERYDREARAYRELWAPVLAPAALELARELAEGQADLVLDVGTGVGTLLPELRKMFPDARVVGIDRSRGMLGLAPAGFPRAAMDATQLAVATASVDRVLMAFMLFHLEQPLVGLREARRVLRRGGCVGVITWAGEFESPATRVWGECLDAHGAAPADPAAAARHEAVDSPEKLEALLGAAGFTSSRAVATELVGTLDREHVVRLKTSLGASKPRFDGLTHTAQVACVNEAERRMSELSPEDFIARGPLVRAIGSV